MVALGLARSRGVPRGLWLARLRLPAGCRMVGWAALGLERLFLVVGRAADARLLWCGCDVSATNRVSAAGRLPGASGGRNTAAATTAPPGPPPVAGALGGGAAERCFVRGRGAAADRDPATAGHGRDCGSAADPVGAAGVRPCDRAADAGLRRPWTRLGFWFGFRRRRLWRRNCRRLACACR
jgi:hypothetical protein